MSSSGIRVHASFRFGADKKEKLLEVMRPLIEATRKEEGCVMYELFEKVRRERISTNGIFLYLPSLRDQPLGVGTERNAQNPVSLGKKYKSLTKIEKKLLKAGRITAQVGGLTTY